ncbi:MAG: ABC transporter permease [Candidatus Eremiobacteraeota bacterium]|nr:ABC transporter permease [Candidatus Eremiobacteraeota bacterium]MCW5866903.1 ABC transporter permease [Candidatus Eremiobacteraeota bacterium]
MFRRLKWLVWKDLLEAMRSQVALLVLVSPLCLAGVLRITEKQGDLTSIPVGVVAPEDSGLIRALSSKYESLVIMRYANSQEGLSHLRSGGPVLLVEVGKDFDKQILAGEEPDVLVWEGDSRPTQVALVREFLRETLRRQAGQKMPARIETPRKGGGTRDMMFLPLVVMAALSAMVVSASNLVEEKEAGTLQQMLLSPAGSTEMWTGKLVVSSALGTLAAMSVVALRGTTLSSLGSALGLTLAASFVFAALGGVVGLLAKGPTAASSWTGFLFFGLFVPVALSETSQTLSRWAKFSPAYPLYDGLQRTVLAQESATTLVAHFGAFLALGAFLTLVGSRLLSRLR